MKPFFLATALLVAIGGGAASAGCLHAGGVYVDASGHRNQVTVDDYAACSYLSARIRGNYNAIDASQYGYDLAQVIDVHGRSVYVATNVTGAHSDVGIFSSANHGGVDLDLDGIDTDVAIIQNRNGATADVTWRGNGGRLSINQ